MVIHVVVVVAAAAAAAAAWRLLPILFHVVIILLTLQVGTSSAANWMQLAGERRQNTVIPYAASSSSNTIHNATSDANPMWTARWGHAVVVLNQTLPRNNLTTEEQSLLLQSKTSVLVLLGGDDYSGASDPNDDSLVKEDKNNMKKGGLRNDVWWTKPISSSSNKFTNNYNNKNRSSRGGWRRINNAQLPDEPFLISDMRWVQSNPGKEPPAKDPYGKGEDVTYLDWIQCQKVFNNDCAEDIPPECYVLAAQSGGCKRAEVWKRDNMWSPRRAHTAVGFDSNILVAGGKAREMIKMLIPVRNELDLDTTRYYSSVREEVSLKNDVWRSDDLGVSWTMVSPGCVDHQEDILRFSEKWESKHHSQEQVFGTHFSSCQSSADCFGSASCKALGLSIAGATQKVCVCNMFSPREHHSMIVQQRFFEPKNNESPTVTEMYFYVFGGFTSIRRSFCAKNSCGSLNNGYRITLDDAWASNDGIHWIQLSPAMAIEVQEGYAPFYSGRANHASILINSDINVSKYDRLWVFGGASISPGTEDTNILGDTLFLDLPHEPCCVAKGSCNDGTGGYHEHSYLTENDIGACLPSFSSRHQLLADTNSWEARAGFEVVYEPRLSQNMYEHRLYIVGGYNKDANVLSDVWSWDLSLESGWKRDFDYNQWFRVENNGMFHFGNSTSDITSGSYGSPHHLYLSGESDLDHLLKWHVPMPSNIKQSSMLFSRESYEPILSKNDVVYLGMNGIWTLNDLIEADLYTILRFRGYDLPGRVIRPVKDICLARALAEDLLHKCMLKSNKLRKKKESNNGGMLISKNLPLKSKKIQKTFMVSGDIYYVSKKQVCEGVHSHCILDTWDGCSPIEDLMAVDIDGIGDVLVPQDRPNTALYLQDMNCKQTPRGRAYTGGAFFDGKVTILGGRGATFNELFRDVWARDDTFPQSSISLKPKNKTKQSEFAFESNKEDAVRFEYKVVDVMERRDVTSWIHYNAFGTVDVGWLDNKKGGPGKGIYGFYVRSMDASGNIDYRFATERNLYIWQYIPSPPWGKIIGWTSFGFITWVLIYFEFSRRRRKAALERYAIRRMRRKFKTKAAEQGLDLPNEDWKALYWAKKKQEIKIPKRNNGNEGSLKKERRSSTSRKQLKNNKVHAADIELGHRFDNEVSRISESKSRGGTRRSSAKNKVHNENMERTSKFKKSKLK